MGIDLPIVSVQHDYTEVVQDVLDDRVSQDKFWISCFKRGHESVHGSVVVTRSGSNPHSTLNFTPERGIAISAQDNVGVA